MTKVEINAGICGFKTIVTVEDKEDYMAVFQLDTQCPNWKKVNDKLGGEKISVMGELFKGKDKQLHSRVLDTALATIPHVSCPVISGILKALEVGVGLALPQNAHICFIEDEK